MTPAPQVLLFDMDGVIADSRVPIARSINHALGTLGLAPRPEPDLYGVVGAPLPDVFADLLAEQGADRSLIPSLMRTYRDRYVELGARETVLYDALPALLEALGARYRLAVATTRPAEFASPVLDALGVGGFFESVTGSPKDAQASVDKATAVARALASVGLDDGQGGEPAPADRHGVRPFDVHAARANGLDTIGVTWGVGSETELREAGATWLAHAPRDLAELLL